MKKFLLLTIIFCASGIILNAQSNERRQQFMNRQVLRHVVLFKFKDNATEKDIQQVENAFKELPTKITTIRNFEWGTNNSPEGLNGGLTHCFFLTFTSEKDRDDYLVHPAHKEFGSVLKPFLEKATVVDYWAKR